MEESRCPACGDFISYCQGHGELGDPLGWQILQQHDEDDHCACDDLSDCRLEKSSMLEEYVIVNIFESDLYWNNTTGWGSLETADRFNSQEKEYYFLPIEGKWKQL